MGVTCVTVCVTEKHPLTNLSEILEKNFATGVTDFLI